MSAKTATLGFHGIRVFGNKVYDVIIHVCDVTYKISSLDSNYIVNMVLWPRFGNSSISVREVIIATILWGFDQKKMFSWGVVLFQVE